MTSRSRPTATRPASASGSSWLSPADVLELLRRRRELEPDARALVVLDAPALGHGLDQHEPPAADLVERLVARRVLEAHAGVAHLNADATRVQCAQLELNDLLLAGAAVAHGVVHQLAGEQQERALELRRQPGRGALDPRAGALGGAGAAGDRDPQALAGSAYCRLNV